MQGFKGIGANPVGVDNRDLTEEEFEHYELDLSKPGALNIFPDKSFDAINCTALVDSPSLRVSGPELDALKKELGLQMKRVLKDDGKILSITDVRRKDVQHELGL